MFPVYSPKHLPNINAYAKFREKLLKLPSRNEAFMDGHTLRLYNSIPWLELGWDWKWANIVAFQSNYGPWLTSALSFCLISVLDSYQHFIWLSDYLEMLTQAHHFVSAEVGYLAIPSGAFIRETTFVTSWWHACIPRHFWKRSTLNLSLAKHYMPCLSKQCRSRSVGFCTVCH